jgi:hypothetical protein
MHTFSQSLLSLIFIAWIGLYPLSRDGFKLIKLRQGISKHFLSLLFQMIYPNLISDKFVLYSWIKLDSVDINA